MTTVKPTGLFLGAGASFEVGMPLVWDLTTELKAWLTPEKLRQLNEGWRKQGGGHPDGVIDDVVAILGRNDVHYESILGHIETQFMRQGAMRDHYHRLYGWMVEMVYWLLYARHTRNVPFIKANLLWLDGMAKLAEKNQPLWVFSLNHDVIVECVAARNGLEVNAGLHASTSVLPRRDPTGRRIGELRVETISADQLEKSGMPFFQQGTKGINLLKVHGGLDLFAFRDGADVLRVLPRAGGVEGVIEALRLVNEELLYVDGSSPQPVKVTNEIAYADEAGEMQFLRRSLLAGAYKFNERHSHALPTRYLRYFKSHLNYLGRLLCVGYGFGDVHINQILREWLEFSAERTLEVVGPGARDVPPFLLHLAPQVTVVSQSATDYFDHVGGIERSRVELATKKAARWLAKRSAKPGLISDILRGARKLRSRRP